MSVAHKDDSCYNGLMLKEGASKSLKFAILSLVILTTITTISALILSSSPSHAETSSVLASVTVPDVCTIAADNSSTAHTDTVGVGEYKANIGETVFNITCNDNNGYSIYAVGYSNNTVGNTNLIGTTNGATIPTGTSTVTGSSAVSNWAMKLTAVNGTFPATILDSYDSYHVVPSTATKVATRTSSIDLSEDSQIKTTYAVSISPAQTADSYVGKVKYTVVHPNYSNADGTLQSYPVTLSFGANTTSITIDGVTYTSSDPAPNLTHGTHTLSSTFPSGYEFSSWSSTSNIAIADSTSASTTISVTGAGTLTLASKASPIPLAINFGTGIYGVMVKSGSLTGGTIDLTSTSTNYYLIPLYTSQYTFNSWTASGGTITSDTSASGGYGYYYYRAQAGVTNTATISAKSLGTTSSTTMQNLSASSCTHAPSAVKDSRDNEVYYIQRLADGKCWMLENLRLGSTSTIALTTSNTNSSGNYTLPASGTVCFATTANCDSSGDSTHTGYTVAAINTVSKTTTTTGYGPGRNYVGVYYNYCAASAGTICSDSNSSNASYDICPAGWKMPTTSSSNNSAGSYYYLYNTGYKANHTAFRYALSTPLSGFIYNDSVRNQDSAGYFWPATRSGNTTMYYLLVNSSNVGPTNTSGSRYDGMSVRCILK